MPNSNPLPTPIAPGRITLGSEFSSDAVELRITDASFGTVASGFSSLSVDLPPGLYEIEMRAGTEFQRKIVRLSSGQDLFEPEVRVKFATPMPLLGTLSSRETYRAALNRLSNIQTGLPGKNAGLVVLIRNMTKESHLPINTRLLDGWRFQNEKGEDVDLAPFMKVNEAEEWLGISAALPAGGYIVLMPNGETVSGQALWLAESWTTGIFIPNTEQGISLDAATVQMTRLGTPWVGEDHESAGAYRAAELAMTAFQDGRALLDGAYLKKMLYSKFENPFLGIIGALALLFDSNAKKELVEEVANNLAALVPGHPDVEAIRFACQHRFKTKFDPPPNPVSFPPFLQASFRWLLAVEAEGTDAIKNGSFAEKVSALRILRSPWSTWRTEASAARLDNANEAAQTIVKQLKSEGLELYPQPKSATIVGNLIVSIKNSLAGYLMENFRRNLLPDSGGWREYLLKNDDLVKFIDGIDLRDPAVAKIVAYLPQIMEEQQQPAALADFLSNLDPHEISRTLGLPLNPVVLFLEKLKEILRFAAAEELSNQSNAPIVRG